MVIYGIDNSVRLDYTLDNQFKGVRQMKTGQNIGNNKFQQEIYLRKEKEIRERLIKTIFGDNVPKSDCNNCPEFYECDGNVNGCKYS